MIIVRAYINTFNSSPYNFDVIFNVWQLGKRNIKFTFDCVNSTKQFDKKINRNKTKMLKLNDL